MAKVKKRAAVTGVRNVKASKKGVAKRATTAKAGKSHNHSSAAASASTGRRVARTAATSGQVGKSRKGKAPQPATRQRASMSKVKSISAARSRARVTTPVPPTRVVVKPLEPQAKCGAGTSVQYLFRVDERVDGRTTTHLVFFDRHGWYCEHGRNCPAVGHAKKHQGHIARAS